jgi:hypothetical protein
MVGQREAFGASDKAFYSQEIDYYTPEKRKGFARHMSIVEANIDAVWPFLQELQRAKGGRIDVLELGGGDLHGLTPPA